jgi:hypothetical protein
MLRASSLTLRAVLAFVGLVAAASPRGLGAASPWWEVRFLLTVRGDYAVKGLATSSVGEFAYRACWEGTMEPDGPDFLLYHTKTEVLDWEIREKTTRPDGTRVLTEKDVADRPRLRLNYILRLGRELRFLFEAQGVAIPLESSPEKFDLVFPCSTEFGDMGAVYDASISKGKNLIAVGADALEKPILEKSFSWEWKRNQWTAREGGAVLVAGFHKATVVVTLVRHR